MRSLIIGMNFGAAVYQPALKSLGYDVLTVDPIAPAMFKNLQQAIDLYEEFETVNICTPNSTHDEIARQIAPHSKIIFVEKPGLINSFSWNNLINDFPNTRICMVKNNQYRDEIKQLKSLTANAKNITLNWINNNRIPSPGSWFTNKSLSFGGVSRDLMPHLLSIYTTISNFQANEKTFVSAIQRYKLQDLTTSDYGIVNKNGIYNVDDICTLEFSQGNTKFSLTADWKSGHGHDEFYVDIDGVRFNLGLCPEIAYREMIRQAVKNRKYDEFWRQHYEQDMWIHQQIENL